MELNCFWRRWTALWIFTLWRLTKFTVGISFRDQGSSLNLTFQLLLYDTAWDGKSSPWTVYPHEIQFDKRVYVELQFAPDVTDTDLKAIVDSCYFGETSDAHSPVKHSLITAGCPSMEAQDEGVALHSSRDEIRRSTRFSFVVSRKFFDKMFMFFHCRVTACSIGGGREKQGFSKCVSSTYCSENSLVSNSVPVKQSYAYYSTGLLHPVMPQAPDSETGCRPCETRTSAAPKMAPKGVHTSIMYAIETEVIFVGQEGPLRFSFLSVVAIAIASFIIGMLLVAALWWAHEKTKPKVYLERSLRRNRPTRNRTSQESGLSSSVDSGRMSSSGGGSEGLTPPPNALTPMVLQGL